MAAVCAVNLHELNREEGMSMEFEDLVLLGLDAGFDYEDAMIAARETLNLVEEALVDDFSDIRSYLNK